jgi:RNA polymerase sigma factor (TIGR02999 family)
MQADATRLLLEWRQGNHEALNRLLPLVYDELRRVAHARLRNERTEHTLGTTALVHEAYLKLVDIDRVPWHDRAHFLATASRLMRRILVDYARRRCADKRGGGAVDLTLDEELLPEDQVNSVIELDDALKRLEADYPRQSKAVELHYFGGLTLEETGGVLGVSAPTVMRDLRFAQAWMARAWEEDMDL